MIPAPTTCTFGKLSFLYSLLFLTGQGSNDTNETSVAPTTSFERAAQPSPTTTIVMQDLLTPSLEGEVAFP